MTKLLKSACFTDIHFGRKNNSIMHNTDCLNFIRWFCAMVKKDDTIDHVIFLGDWHEHRASVDGLTLDYSIEGAELLNELGMPVFMIVGNHDLYYRNKRDVFTTRVHSSFKNITLVNKPKVFKNIGVNGSLICPYLFHNEYPKLLSYLDTNIWFGHFEFNGFVLTGETKLMEGGPDPDEYSNPDRIFCGHFHKRQKKKNIQYIGNAFPADFSDANDFERGMMVYDHTNDDTIFTDWEECPKYIKTTLTDLQKNASEILKKDARVVCLVDQNISFEESNIIKEEYVTEYELRELRLEESNDLQEVLEDSNMSLDGLETESTENIIKDLIGRVESEFIDSDKLKNIFEGLK